MKKTTIAVLTTILLIALCVLVGAGAWAPNMEADYEGFGYVGVALPVFAVLCAFILGRATEGFLQGQD